MTDRPVLRRAAIVATMITGMIPFLSPCLAASDAEISSVGEKMSGAFKCSTYASLFHDGKEQQRLFQIGLKAGREEEGAAQTARRAAPVARTKRRGTAPAARDAPPVPPQTRKEVRTGPFPSAAV